MIVLTLWLALAAYAVICITYLSLRRREAQPGLNTFADADTFVLELRAESKPADVWGFPVGERLLMETPVFDAVVADRRRQASVLRMPTVEMLTVFSAIAEHWLCSYCAGDDCASCPGCSCPCKLPARPVQRVVAR